MPNPRTAVDKRILVVVAVVLAGVACTVSAPRRAPVAVAPVSGYVDVGTTTIYYETAGRGETVILLHGGWTSVRQWDEQIDSLARDYHVVRYDARGYGRSPLGDSAYAHHEDLRALFRHLGIERAHLVALSNGSTIALEFALTHPGLVRSMSIGPAPMPGYDLGQEFTTGIRAISRAGGDRDIELTRRLIWDFAPLRVASTMPAVRARLDTMFLRDHTWPQSRAGAPARQRLHAPLAQLLPQVAGPVLIVVGDGEMPVLRQQADSMARAIPGAELVVIPGAGHVVNMEQPARFTRVLLDWLRSRRGAAE